MNGLTKQDLRRKICDLRQHLDPADLNSKSQRIGERLTEIPAFVTTKKIALYVSLPTEVQTIDLINGLLRENRRTVYLPRVNRIKKALEMVLIRYPDRELNPGVWGIKEPVNILPSLNDLSELDLVIVPGLTFDRTGNRLGYGGGFYDRFLSQIPNTMSIGLVLEQFLSDNIPHNETDRRVHYVCTEKQIYLCEGI